MLLRLLPSHKCKYHVKEILLGLTKNAEHVYNSLLRGKTIINDPGISEM